MLVFMCGGRSSVWEGLNSNQRWSAVNAEQIDEFHLPPVHLPRFSGPLRLDAAKSISNEAERRR